MSDFNTPETADSAQSNTVHCPICGVAFPDSQNFALNRHIDNCLSAGVVRQIVREVQSNALTAKKRRLTDYFAHKIER